MDMQCTFGDFGMCVTVRYLNSKSSTIAPPDSICYFLLALCVHMILCVCVCVCACVRVWVSLWVHVLPYIVYENVLFACLYTIDLFNYGYFCTLYTCFKL